MALVALIDAADVEGAAQGLARRPASESAAFPRPCIRIERPDSTAECCRPLTKALRKAKNLSTYLVRHRLKELRDEIRMRLFRSYLDRGRRLPRALRADPGADGLPVRREELSAERPVSTAKLVLFRATHGEGHDEPYIERYEDPLLGWGRRAHAGVSGFTTSLAATPACSRNLTSNPGRTVAVIHQRSLFQEAVDRV